MRWPTPRVAEGWPCYGASARCGGTHRAGGEHGANGVPANWAYLLRRGRAHAGLALQALELVNDGLDAGRVLGRDAGYESLTLAETPCPIGFLCCRIKSARESKADDDRAEHSQNDVGDGIRHGDTEDRRLTLGNIAGATDGRVDSHGAG
jgi:hypothetical protein